MGGGVGKFDPHYFESYISSDVPPRLVAMLNICFARDVDQTPLLTHYRGILPVTRN